MDNKKPPDGQVPGQLRVGGGVGENGEAISLGNVGGARAGMDKEAFLRVFSDVQVRDVEVDMLEVCVFYKLKGISVVALRTFYVTSCARPAV